MFSVVWLHQSKFLVLSTELVLVGTSPISEQKSRRCLRAKEDVSFHFRLKISRPIFRRIWSRSPTRLYTGRTLVSRRALLSKKGLGLLGPVLFFCPPPPSSPPPTPLVFPPVPWWNVKLRSPGGCKWTQSPYPTSDPSSEIDYVEVSRLIGTKWPGRRRRRPVQSDRRRRLQQMLSICPILLLLVI